MTFHSDLNNWKVGFLCFFFKYLAKYGLKTSETVLISKLNYKHATNIKK